MKSEMMDLAGPFFHKCESARTTGSQNKNQCSQRQAQQESSKMRAIAFALLRMPDPSTTAKVSTCHPL
jgi:hypothetical protein